jgi:NADPH:quinone reductase-like Zn-dependent oxidoreductase
MWRSTVSVVRTRRSACRRRAEVESPSGTVSWARALSTLARSVLALFVGARLRGRRGSFYGITMLYRKNPRPFHEDLPKLFDLLAQRKISPRIAQTSPLLDARKANERLEAGGIDGKLVLVAFDGPDIHLSDPQAQG